MCFTNHLFSQVGRHASCQRIWHWQQDLPDQICQVSAFDWNTNKHKKSVLAEMDAFIRAAGWLHRWIELWPSIESVSTVTVLFILTVTLPFQLIWQSLHQRLLLVIFLASGCPMFVFYVSAIQTGPESNATDGVRDPNTQHWVWLAQEHGSLWLLNESTPYLCLLQFV